MPLLIVVQAPGFALAHGRFAIESAFAAHLKTFRTLLDPHFSGIVLIAPQWTTAQYEAQKAQMSVLDESTDGIRFVPAYSLDVSRPAFLTRHLLPTWRLLRRETAASGAVNSGMSTNLGHPIMFMACLAARRAGKPVIFMTDIDFREHARRSYRLGRWNWREYAVNHYVYNRLKSLQLRLAPRLFDVVCLKGASLVRDFGGGRPNVHNVYDTVHGADDILDADALAGRVARLEAPGQPLNAVFFGRLVATKGLDRALEGVRRARLRGADVRITFIGLGESLDGLRAAARDPALAGAVTFHGPVAYGPDLFALLAPMDVAIATPLLEDTPRAAFDAMARGLPLVAFDITYFRDLAEASGAVALAEWPDPDAIADRLVELAGNRGALVEMTRRAVAFAADNTQAMWLNRRIAWLLETGKLRS